MQLDAPQQNSTTPQSDPSKVDERAALEAFGRLPTAAATPPPLALSIELPEGDSIDCYDLAARIADVMETPCCKVETVGRTRRTINPSTDLALGTRRASTEPDLKTRLAAYRDAPYSPEWDPDLEPLSPVQQRRLAERARRMQDFQQRVKRGVLTVFTQAYDATNSVGASTYMTRGSAEQYLLACGFRVKERPTPEWPQPRSETRHFDNGVAESEDALNASAPQSKLMPVTNKPRSKANRPKQETPSSPLHSDLQGDGHLPLSRSAVMQQPGKQNSPVAKRILRASEAIDRTGLGRTSFYNRMNPSHPDFDPRFPKRVSIGRRAVGFRESEVDEWIDRQAKK